MKEYLHLFEELKNSEPTEEGSYLTCDKKGIFSTRYWVHEGAINSIKLDNRILWAHDVTHWLDLSKLTTKERAINEVLQAVVNECGNISIKEKQVITDGLYERL